MKKTVYIITILVVLLLLGLLIFKQVNTNTDKNVSDIETINIGAVFPFTGKIAEYGKYWKEGIELAYKDAKAQRIKNIDKVNLFFEDGKGEPTKSVNAFHKLIDINHIQVGFSATSGVTLALKPIANKNKILLMNASAISTKIEDNSDYVYSVIPNAAYTGKFLANTAFNRLSKRNAGILYRNDASGVSFMNEFKKQFMKNGGKIVYESAHKLNNTDFTPFILELKKLKNIDVLFVASWGPEVAYFVKQAKENNLNIQVLAYETFKSPKVLEIAGNAADGVIFSSPKLIEIENPKLYNVFKNKVKTYFNSEEINYHILGHYDAAMLLFGAISKGNYSSTEIKKYFDNMDSFNGVTGEIKFNENGGVILPLGLYTVKNKKFVKY